MRRCPMVGIALVTGVLIAAAVPTAYAKAKSPPDLGGEWRLNADKSQRPNPPERSQSPRGGGMGRGGGRRGGGGEDGGGAGGSDGAGSGRGGTAVRSAWLPPRLSIHVAEGKVRLADTTGTEVAEIQFDSSTPPADSSPTGVKRLTGKWKGSQLQATFEETEGAKITETFSLQSKGRTLEIKTKVEPAGNRPSFSFKRVYEKLAG
jgi:hypothetical protein